MTRRFSETMRTGSRRFFAADILGRSETLWRKPFPPPLSLGDFGLISRYRHIRHSTLSAGFP